MHTISIQIAVIYFLVSLINLIGLALVFCPEESRKNEIAAYRERGNFKGYSDWQVIALLVCLAIFPYFNIGLYDSCLAVTCEQVSEWLEPFGKKKA
ncbi:hypothetical protein ACWKW6_12815 [Dyadobacter jiangsuensis]